MTDQTPETIKDASDALSTVPRIQNPSGPDYADQKRMFQGIPGLAIAPNNRLWATWYGGGVTEDQDNYVMLATSSDGGMSWSEPEWIIDPDGSGPVRAFDPCLWVDPDERLWWFWAQAYDGHTDSSSGVWAVVTRNAGAAKPQWSEPRRLCDGVMMNKPTVLTSGLWLLPVARWHAEESAGVLCSKDKGVSWQYWGGASIPRAEDRNCDEHMILERRDGSLWMLVRTVYGLGESHSQDEGRTWSQVAPGNLKHTTSRFCIRRLHSGNLLLVKHGPLDQRIDRSQLTAYSSPDDGQTWSAGLMLDARSEVSYPDAVQDIQDAIYLIYDYQRSGAKEILLAKFTEDDVFNGRPSPNTRLRMLVNKAYGTL